MRFVWLCLAAAVACAAQTPDWTAMGSGGSVQPSANGAIFTYDLKPDQIALAVRPATPEFAHMQRLRFRVKSSADTPVAIVLSEHKPGGANYNAIFWAPANTWQSLELTPADFTVSDGAAVPPDPDGRLDLDQVEGIAILDLAHLFRRQRSEPDSPFYTERPTGRRTMEIADFEILAGPVASPARMIDSFDRGFVEWITPGGVKLAPAVKANPLSAPAMQAILTAPDGRAGMLIRRVGNLNLAKAVRLTFDVACENETTLVVSLEMKNGQRFNQTIFPPGKREAFHVNLKLADFEGESTFDPAQWKSIAIGDISGDPNTLWLARMGIE